MGVDIPESHKAPPKPGRDPSYTLMCCSPEKRSTAGITRAKISEAKEDFMENILHQPPSPAHASRQDPCVNFTKHFHPHVLQHLSSNHHHHPTTMQQSTLRWLGLMVSHKVKKKKKASAPQERLRIFLSLLPDGSLHYLVSAVVLISNMCKH